MSIQPFLIGGEWIKGNAVPIESVNPATGELNGYMGSASAADVDHAVTNALQAQRQPSWRNMLPHERARLLYRVAELIIERGPQLSAQQMRENGKLLSECSFQAAAAAGAFRYFAGICETMVSEVAPSRGQYLSTVVYEPFGVVAAITPWNSPLTLEAQKVAAAVAAGNAVVLKPSEFTPTLALELGRIFIDAGFPPGILNVVTGSGPEAGLALVQHPDVRMISFTGGTATGRTIAKIAGERLVPTALELGGKSPHIIFADADLDAALDAVVMGIFSSSGQSCIAGSRLFIERSIYDEFLGRVVERTRALRVGPPDAPQSQVASLSSFIHRERVERYVASALEEGGQILVGGKRPDAPELEKGAYYEPTIIAGLPSTATVCQEEIFGPVLCVLPFDDEADLIDQANGTVYGLGCGIWTESFKKAWRVGRAIESGTVWINTYKALSVATPFGGFKDSGIGREKGFYGIRVYQEAKTIYLGLG
jgi:acyl-CoA reductase-like NAD-dependent aldehyde dehydrogenase